MDSKLSKDMTIEIVSRKSLRSFDAMRCTSKELNKLTYESNLLNLYKQRNHIVSGLIIQRKTSSYSKKYIKEFVPSPESKSLHLGFLPDDARIRASSEQGIIVVERPHLLFYVCKPATKQLIQLPHPKHNYGTDKVSIVIMNSMPLRYKVVKFSRLPGGDQWQSTYCCEIFDSSISEVEWRLVDPIKLPDGNLLASLPITTKGSIYSLLTNGYVLKFNAYSEKWTSTFSVPKETRDFLAYPIMKLIKYDGKLGFACKQLRGFWEIWVLAIDESWVKTYVLNKKEDTKRLSFAGLYDSDTSIMVDFNEVLYHRFRRDDKLRNRPDESFATSGLPDETFHIRSDFDLIDLG